MTEELNNESGVDEVNGSVDYIEAINQLKQNTVSKEDFLKVKQENQQLLKSLVEGGQIEQPKVNTEQSIKDLRKDLYGGSELSNLEYISKTLQLRKALIDSGEVDPFLPNGHKVVPEQTDYDKAEKVATVLQECVDYADGDSNVFTTELQRHLADTYIPRRK